MAKKISTEEVRAAEIEAARIALNKALSPHIGQTLDIESLEATLKSTVWSMKDIKLWGSIPKRPNGIKLLLAMLDD